MITSKNFVLENYTQDTCDMSVRVIIYKLGLKVGATGLTDKCLYNRILILIAVDAAHPLISSIVLACLSPSATLSLFKTYHNSKTLLCRTVPGRVKRHLGVLHISAGRNSYEK